MSTRTSLAALVCFAFAAPAGAAEYFPPPESSGGWRRVAAANATPNASQKAKIRANAGLDWDVLRKAWNASSKYGGTLLVIRNGWIAAEWGKTNAQAIASCTKTVTALTMHKVFDASAAGRFSMRIDPDDPAFHYLPSAWGNHATRRNITIRHLMTMSSGLVPDDSPPSPSSGNTSAYLKKMQSPPVATQPGREWIYASLPVDTLSMIAQRVTGERLGTFFQREIGNKIGVKSMKWASLGTYSYASAYAEVTPRDLARIAYLLMKKGKWNGKTVVSAARIREMTRPEPDLTGTKYGKQVKFPTDPTSNWRYGHLTWTNGNLSPYVGAGVPQDAFYFAGFRTKFVLVVPSLDLVVIRIQDTPAAWSDPVFKTLTTTVMEALVG